EAPEEPGLVEPRLLGRRAELELNVVEKENSATRAQAIRSVPAEPTEDVVKILACEAQPVLLPVLGQDERSLYHRSRVGERHSQLRLAAVGVPANSAHEELDHLASPLPPRPEGQRRGTRQVDASIRDRTEVELRRLEAGGEHYVEHVEPTEVGTGHIIELRPDGRGAGVRPVRPSSYHADRGVLVGDLAPGVKVI